jgi:hypothetical protein
MAKRSCSVVDSNECRAALPENPASELVTCWGCGDDVCRSCSSVIEYPVLNRGARRSTRVRMCFTCQDTRRVGRAAKAR